MPRGHKPTPPELRFWDKVDAEGDCWLWLGRKTVYGYGSFWLTDAPGEQRTVFAHRFAWHMLVGPIPDGLQMDHLCRVRHCVNPDHLEPVTSKENLMRGFSPPFIVHKSRSLDCKNGHPWIENERFDTKGKRWCATCSIERSLTAYYAKKGRSV